MNNSNNPIYEFLRHAKGVIHIGASTGQERTLYAHLNLPVVWIEADPETFKELQENTKLYGNQKAINYLITNKNEPNLVEFHRANNGFSSSVLKLLKHKEIWPDVEMVDSIYIHQYTLEHALLAEGIDPSRYDALVLDVQGAELLVLEGAKKILHNFKYIRCEATNAELYEGQCLDHNLDKFLYQAGFKRNMTWAMKESTNEIGIFEILYQSMYELKNTKITDPKSGNTVELKVGVIVSEPRLGFSVNKSVMHNAFGARGYPICKVQGAFWEQSIQNAMNNAIRLGCDVLITVDYDSIFTHDDVNHLLLMAVRYPDADLVTSWQLKRHDGPPSALLGWMDANGSFLSNVPAKVATEEITEIQHCVFGLTLLKVNKLLKMPKPWFQSFPNADGEWEEGKIDADSYFMRKWRETGNTMFAANAVKIGHLDEVVLWIDDEYQPIRQSLTSFYREGRPF